MKIQPLIKITNLLLLLTFGLFQSCGMSLSDPENGKWSGTAPCIINSTCSPEYDHDVDGKITSMQIVGTTAAFTLGYMEYHYPNLSTGARTCKSFLVFAFTRASDGARVFKDNPMDGCLEGYVALTYDSGADKLKFDWSVLSDGTAVDNSGDLTRVP